MSAPPSPHLGPTGSAKPLHKKRERPPTLDIPDHEVKAASDGEIRYERVAQSGDVNEHTAQQPSFHVSPAEGTPDAELPTSRSGSATSSLDPYYFGLQSPSDSPLPPLPSAPLYLSMTPEMRPINEPVTPGKDPATIDRRGLVGVGELATPRWTRTEHHSKDSSPDPEPEHEAEDAREGYEIVQPEDAVEDEPDSPWTIEAVDGESSGKEEPSEVKSSVRPLRARPSMTEESGGEEILYPRQAHGPAPDVPKRSGADSLKQPTVVEEPSTSSESAAPTSPPSSFSQAQRKAKKRTSDEFEIDQSGSLVTKRLGSSSGLSKDRSKEEKPSARKHRSLGVGSPASARDKGRERRRESIGVGLSINSSLKSSISTKAPEKHNRQASASSSSSNHAESIHPRRVHTTDFSHLPPSPSSSSIQQFLRHTGTSNTPPLGSSSSKDQHSSPNVAHSLLRGTQEGWSGLDDEATAEALRKLDGLTGKSARARASVSSFGRPNGSRPVTPAGKTGTQWEGVEGGKASRRTSTNNGKDKDKDPSTRQTIGLGLVSPDVPLDSSDLVGSAIASSDDQKLSSSTPEKTPKKAGTASARLSFTPKRGSASSTTYTSTPTTSSRDSASLSAATSATSVSAASGGRHPSGKTRRNSAGSDISSNHSSDATSLKDRVAALAVTGDAPEDDPVPPVPPLPKDLSTYRSPPPSSSALTFPTFPTVEDYDQRNQDSDSSRPAALEVPSFTSPPPQPTSPSATSRRQSQPYVSGYTSLGSTSESVPVVMKTPSKKWSFSSALNIKLSSSPSGQKSGSSFPLSPRGSSFGQQLRKSTSKDQALTTSSGKKSPWSQPDAMTSAASLASLSSVGSMRNPKSPGPVTTAKTPEMGMNSSRSGTDSSASTNHTTFALSAPQPGPLSPSSSIRRNQSKRLTPSSIPFFRRSSSQSMQFPPSNTAATSSSPTLSSGNMSTSQTRSKANTSPSKDYNPASTSVPGSAHKKSSVLSLGLPSLLKGSSSRRSLHADSKEMKESHRLKEAVKEREKQEKQEKERQKKEDKERSESRVSVLLGGRKRGKTLSSTEPRKTKSPVNLPPMQMSALTPATAQRVARLKSSSSTSTPAAPTSSTTRTSSSSRLTSQTASSMQKQSDSSLRSRNHLPTIAGSPSVGTNIAQAPATARDPPPLTSLNSSTSIPKETPTKIPRISSRTSTVASPQLKSSLSTLVGRRASLNASGIAISSAEPSPTPGESSMNEFGMMEDNQTPKVAASTSRRSSPSALSTPRIPRQVSATAASGSVLPRKSNRDSISFTGIRKSSTSSVASSVASVPPPAETSHHRFSALSPSKGLKLLSPKMSLPTSRASNVQAAQNIHQAMGSPSSSRQSLSTPSPVLSSVDEDEVLGDEEMMHYIKRQQSKKIANGATKEELDELLCFPEPLPPGTPSSPAAVLKSSQAQYLSEYEQKEILDYPSVYCIGARSKKKPAHPDNSSNNYGYDDERGDYLVVNRDHLAYRYEVIDTLGKGSFGQVLHCRDHCTGESVAIKIIRNKKRFHHQALVEIKILDNLRKWDSEEKHHVIKMTEHFYFRNHLCIAMELLSINLYELIKANGFVGFTTALIRRFTSQMLLSLSLMRHHRIVHCDLKPENVLLRHPAKSAIKVIDFGSSCFEHEKIYTYIQSRFYRSPEVILGMNYHMAIDMWSLGCILAELYTGFPIFPGENEQEQLSCIMEVLGIPDKEFVNRSSRKRLFFEANGAPRAVVNSKGRRRRPGSKTLAQVLRCNDDEFIDFIAKCLVWDPERRIKPQAAMRHPFVTAGRQSKVPAATAKAMLSSSSLSVRKPTLETPKKSQISAPTPLAARTPRGATGAAPSTPSGSSSHATTLGSASKSYRTSQSQGLSAYHSSRTLSGFATTAAKS